MNFVIIEFADDTIGIMSLNLEPTDENIEQEILKSRYELLPPAGTKTPIKGWWRFEGTHADMEQQLGGRLNRIFRKAYRYNVDTKKLVINMEAAKEKYMDHFIRPMRDAKLKELDVQWSKEIAQKQSFKAAQAIEDKRQNLRDIPQNFSLDSATTPEELRALWPEGIDKPWWWNKTS